MITFKEHAQLQEAIHLDNVNHVYHNVASTEFAKHYVAAKRGDYRKTNPTPADDKAAEHFDSTYHANHQRGFGGSGTSVYTHKQTGHKFEVKKSANGKTFYGTDHVIRKL